MWQTRIISTFVAATVPVENAGDTNPLLEAAQTIGEPSTGEDETATESTEPDDNGVGSYERFMLSFGSPARWAGRS